MTKTDSDRIEKQIELNAPIQKVWEAISDAKQFGEWFGVQLENPFEEGKKNRGKITTPGYDHLVMELEVVQIAPTHLFSYHWHPYSIDPNVDYSNEPPTLVEFRLEESEAGTLLKLTESGFDSLPPNRKDEAFRMNEGGWSAQVVNIQKHIENG